MRFLNPKTDFAFKKIFGSEQSKDILMSFLNAILDLEQSQQIVEITILDPYLAPKIEGMKNSYLDIKAKDEQGRTFIIEMQVLNVIGFEKRVLYNACKAYSGQIQRGDEYKALTDVIAITLTDFEMFPELTGVVHRFKMRGEEGHIYSDDLELVFAELPKFNKASDELATILDKWFYFMKFAGDLQAVPEYLSEEPAIAHAFDLANEAGLTKAELEKQENYEIFIQDQRGAVEFALLKGHEKGHEEGREKGREEGREEGREVGREEGREEGIEEGVLKVARSLLDILDDVTIAKKTDLPLVVVKKLREQEG